MLEKLAWAVGIAALMAFIAVADNYQLFVLALVGLTTIVGIGLNVLLGLTGQISLGHVAFYAIGAYTVAILTTKTALSFWLALPIGVVIAGLAGLVLAVPALRVRGPYLAMVTIAFGFIVEQLAAEGGNLTGGWNGISGIPSPSLPGLPFREREIAVMVLALTLAALWLYARFKASPWGNAMRAVSDSAVASQSIGLDPTMLRTVAFAISAAVTGLAGGVFAAMSDFISPESFPFFQSILFLLVVMVGGAGSTTGPLIGAFIVVLVPELLSWLAQYRLLFVGLLLLVVLLIAPEGFAGLWQRLKRRSGPSRPSAAARDLKAILADGAGPQLLAAHGLSVSFGGVRAVEGLNFKAEPGRITSIIGPNGAGKSTVLNLVCGFYKPDKGQVAIGTQDITGRASHQIARAGIARTYQTTQLFASMSVLDNVLVALHRGRLGIGEMLIPDLDLSRRAHAESLLAAVGYRDDVERLAGSLPHVDKRIVEIARALATRPSVLLLDEPAAGLDDADTKRVGAMLVALAQSGMNVVLVEHDMGLVMGISDHIVVLDAGQKIAEGPPAVVAADPRVKAAYLGSHERTPLKRKRPLSGAGEPVLSARGLSSGYGPITVIRDVSLEVADGEMVAVLGSNGAGKSTLLATLAGLNRPSGGEVLLLGSRIESFSASRVAAAGLVLVPEGRQVFPELSVTDNIRLGAYARDDGRTEERIEELLRRFPRLAERRNQRAGLLSGGEQQMLAIARGLIARPRVLMLDEPSLGLAPKLIEGLYEQLEMLREEGTTILLVDQMAEHALSVADRVYVLESGRVARSGEAAVLARDPALVEAYLGKHSAARASSSTGG